MPLIDTVLRLLRQQNGDRAVLGLGVPPELTRGGVPLRLFFPTVTEAMRSQLLDGLLTPAREEILASEGKLSFRYTPDDSSDSFDVLLEGPGPDRSTFDLVDVAVPADEPEVSSVVRSADPVEAAVANALAAARGVVTSRRVPEELAGSELAGMLGTAERMGASDLHLSQGEVPVLRVHGLLRPVPQEGAVDALSLLSPLLDDEAERSLEAGGSLDLGLKLGRSRIRAHIYRASHGLAAALRLLPRHPPTLASLRLPVSLVRHLDRPHGLVLISGPTGSGKSTTLAAAQHVLQRRGGLMVTLEDPIEYVFSADGRGSLVRQRQVRRDVPDFASGLRDALREDPDLLLVGELRDAESISLAITAAETGHLVLASTHARSAASAVERLIGAVAPNHQAQLRTQLANSLSAVIAQRLLPASSGEGRIVAMEVMAGTMSVANLIREGKTSGLATAIQSGAAEGMLPLERCLRDLVNAGRITAEVARAAANDPESLRLYDV